MAASGSRRTLTLKMTHSLDMATHSQAAPLVTHHHQMPASQPPNAPRLPSASTDATNVPCARVVCHGPHPFPSNDRFLSATRQVSKNSQHPSASGHTYTVSGLLSFFSSGGLMKRVASFQSAGFFPAGTRWVRWPLPS